MAKKILRVGFDLDGVLLYNPARIARPIVTFAKHAVGHRSKTTFYIPHSPLQQFVWKVLHYSSLFPASGLDKIKRLVAHKKIEAYIITGRYGFLKDDFDKWLEKINTDATFQKTILNELNEQPHIYKTRTVKNLDLDIFVEDNWDIVKQLNAEPGGPEVIWIYNMFDWHITYKPKFLTLKKAVDYIEKKIR
jgi:uncharacterized HAD superfamily protein